LRRPRLDRWDHEEKVPAPWGTGSAPARSTHRKPSPDEAYQRDSRRHHPPASSPPTTSFQPDAVARNAMTSGLRPGGARRLSAGSRSRALPSPKGSAASSSPRPTPRGGYWDIADLAHQFSRCCRWSVRSVTAATPWGKTPSSPPITSSNKLEKSGAPRARKPFTTSGSGATREFHQAAGNPAADRRGCCNFCDILYDQFETLPPPLLWSIPTSIRPSPKSTSRSWSWHWPAISAPARWLKQHFEADALPGHRRP